MPKGSEPARTGKAPISEPEFTSIRDDGDVFVHRLKDGRIKISLLGWNKIDNSEEFEAFAKEAPHMTAYPFMKKLTSLLFDED
jgi:hypothetical protein